MQSEVLLDFEQAILRRWRRQSRPYLKRIPRNDWEWLAVGQHHGLSTRLLDWTANPLAAAFFALIEPSTEPSAIYCLRCPNLLDDEKPLKEFSGVAVYLPPHIIDRVIRQDSYFSVSETPFRDLAGMANSQIDLVQLIVPLDLRELFLRKVVSFGTDYSTLFPSLDGVAASINWRLDDPMHRATGELRPRQELMELTNALRGEMAELESRLNEISGEIT